MDGDAELVAEAVRLYGVWARHEEAMRFTDRYADEVEYEAQQDEGRAYEREERRVVALDGERALALVRPYLDSGDRYERDVAALLLGRIAARRLGTFTARVSDLLLARLPGDSDPDARDGLATGLTHVWHSVDDPKPLELARHPDANVRYAAAHSLALDTTDRPGDEDARAALAELLNDPDEDVRGWAEFGLETLSVD
jgi:HEAT repeat protein